MEPTVGRIVHFYEETYSITEGTHMQVSPAIILKVHDSQVVDLLVHGPIQDERLTGVRFGDGENRTWVWPPRV